MPGHCNPDASAKNLRQINLIRKYVIMGQGHSDDKTQNVVLDRGYADMQPLGW